MSTFLLPRFRKIVKELEDKLKEKQYLVVGDFCLPYRLNQPNICHKIPEIKEASLGNGIDTALEVKSDIQEEELPLDNAEEPPLEFQSASALEAISQSEEEITLSLGKTHFCEDDTTRYQFTLTPAGGQLQGEGLIQEHEHYYFKPSLLGPVPRVRELSFTYQDNDVHQTLVVSVYPLPDATFIIGDGTSSHFSTADGLLPLVPDQVGGRFKAWQEPPEVDQPREILDAITFQGGRFFFNPAAVSLNPGASSQVLITHTVTNKADCTNQISVHVMITSPSAKVGDPNEL